jgi:hypothetical protein
MCEISKHQYDEMVKKSLLQFEDLETNKNTIINIDMNIEKFSQEDINRIVKKVPEKINKITKER